MRTRSLAMALVALAAPSSLGCAVDSVDVEVTPFGDRGQRPRIEDVAYPPGPYGYAVGTTIADLAFEAFSSWEDQHLRRLAFDAFSNPDDDPQKPKLLLVSAEHVWCPPSNVDAGVMTMRYPLDHARGAEFMGVLEDGRLPGTPADERDLSDWSLEYRTPYPTGVDPEDHLFDYAPADYLPLQIVVDTRSMTIVERHVGETDEAFWDDFDARLAAR